MKTIRLLSLLLAFTLGAAAYAQDEEEYRLEVGAAAGLVSSMDDTNSALFGNTGFGGGAVLRFLLNPRMAVKTAFTCGKLSGATDDIKRFYPANQNAASDQRLAYAYNGAVYDLSVLYEIHFLPYGYARGYQGFKRLTPYLQAGVGIVYSTAGKAVAPNIPIGFGLKYKVARRLNLGLEWRMHFTTGDKIDGLEAPLGIKSSGFRNKDHYSFTMFTLTYDIAPKCPNCNKD